MIITENASVLRCKSCGKQHRGNLRVKILHRDTKEFTSHSFVLCQDCILEMRALLKSGINSTYGKVVSKAKKSLAVSTDYFQDMCDSLYGYCTTCGDFTRDSTESDAQDYDCPQCGENTVMGADNAMLEGLLVIE